MKKIFFLIFVSSLSLFIYSQETRISNFSQKYTHSDIQKHINEYQVLYTQNKYRAMALLGKTNMSYHSELNILIDNKVYTATLENGYDIRFVNVDFNKYPNDTVILIIDYTIRGGADGHSDALLGTNIYQIYNNQIISLTSLKTAYEGMDYSYYGTYEISYIENEIYVVTCFHNHAYPSSGSYVCNVIHSMKDGNNLKVICNTLEFTPKYIINAPIFSNPYLPYNEFNTTRINLHYSYTTNSSVKYIFKGNELFKILSIYPVEEIIDKKTGFWIQIATNDPLVSDTSGIGWVWSNFVK